MLIFNICGYFVAKIFTSEKKTVLPSGRTRGKTVVARDERERGDGREERRGEERARQHTAAHTTHTQTTHFAAAAVRAPRKEKPDLVALHSSCLPAHRTCIHNSFLKV